MLILHDLFICTYLVWTLIFENCDLIENTFTCWCPVKTGSGRFWEWDVSAGQLRVTPVISLSNNPVRPTSGKARTYQNCITLVKLWVKIWIYLRFEWLQSLAQLKHLLPEWDWQSLTFRAVIRQVVTYPSSSESRFIWDPRLFKGMIKGTLESECRMWTRLVSPAPGREKKKKKPKTLGKIWHY